MASIIVVDDDPHICRLFSRILSGAGHSVAERNTVAGFIELMESESFDVVLLDVHLPDGRGEEVVPDLLERDPFLFVIVISGDVSVETAVSATRRGAYDYLTKPFTAEALLHVVAQALDARRLAIARAASDRNPLRRIVSQRRLVGSSPAICAVNLMIDRVAKTPSTPVLVTGESGTGKEMAAEAIHQLSSRREGPIIKVNCSAIPRHLVEAELFGHERGAFTDARDARKGLFELADGGTIFLDEVGDLDQGVQPKLLRVLEDRAVSRIGSEHARKVDIRVIAATNRDLGELCQHGEFREDLYSRLAVMRIHMPPLRKHAEDIEKLAYLFLQEKGMELSKRVYGFSDEVLSFFRRYSWPGNVRELKNMVERLVILADSDVIQLDETSLRRYCFMGDVAQGLPELPASAPATSATAPGSEEDDDFEVRSLDEVEKDYLCRALLKLRFNKSRCARALGISRSTLQRKIAVYGLEEWIERHQRHDR